MLAATHMLAGATVYGLTHRNKLISLPLAFASHFGLDRVHHYDLNMTKNVLIGIPIILFVFYLGWKMKDVFIVIAAFLGMLPDLISILGISPSFHRIHMQLHFEPYYPLPLYLLAVEAVLAVFLIGYLYWRGVRS
ncbi:hypothetical protein [Halalkalibacter urbisdiaboli]|uniref:hypothetical protein n=1 Tax=Halalkalibacter urbisdiaboli TaxID=1960589 RepID=UPI000B43BB98|nr:hypothetical protein [Halalkalibacter urbisdiaboli]